MNSGQCAPYSGQHALYTVCVTIHSAVCSAQPTLQLFIEREAVDIPAYGEFPCDVCVVLVHCESLESLDGAPSRKVWRVLSQL